MKAQEQNLDRVVTVEVADRRQVASVEVEVEVEVRRKRVAKAEGEGHLRVAVEVEEGWTLLEHLAPALVRLEVEVAAVEQHWGYAAKARAGEQVDQKLEAARLVSLGEAEVRRQRVEVQHDFEWVPSESAQAVEELGLVAEEEVLLMVSFRLRKEEVHQT